MNTPAPRPTYIFVNPNTSGEFAERIGKILIEKLLSIHRDTTAAR